MSGFVHPPKAQPGDHVAILSPAFAAPGFAPEVHEQALTRLIDATGLVPVEYPTTRRLGATPQDRAADLNDAFGDPAVRAVLATIGGDDQITVMPHLDAAAMTRDPKPFLGYSDNTNLTSWLWAHGITSFYGGSTQVHLGAGPGIDAIHRAGLRAALLSGERLEITDPGESEDFGVDWKDPAALTQNGERETTEPWAWSGPAKAVTGRTWGGCIEVIQEILMAARFPIEAQMLNGGVLLLETSEEVISADGFRRLLRALGERGMLAAAEAILLARPPASNQERRPPAQQRAAYRAEQRDVAFEVIEHYNPEAVVCAGVPFGHTRPQWILPYGGQMTIDGENRQIFADYR